MASTVIGPLDVFYQAGVMWNYFKGRKLTPYFNVQMVTSNGRSFKCLSGICLQPQGSIYDVQHPDLIIISSILDIDRTLKYEGEVIGWLKA
jgi:hypothetical protein